MYSATHPKGESFYACLPLSTVSGATSHETPHTFPDGSVCPTIRAAAAARGLLRDSAEYREEFRKEAYSASTESLRHSFATLLPSCAPQDPGSPYTEPPPHLAEDVHRDTEVRGRDLSLPLNAETVVEAPCRLGNVLRRLGSFAAYSSVLPSFPTERPGA